MQLSKPHQPDCSRTAIFADIHGCSPALEAVLADIRRAGCGQVYVLGDIINGPDPHGCVELLRGWQAETGVNLACIKGNAEMYLLTPALEHMPRLEIPWNRPMINLIGWFNAHLTPADLAWIAALPDYRVFDHTCLVHDSPIDRLAPHTWHDPDLPLHYQEWFYHAPGIRADMPEAEWLKLTAFMDEHAIQRVFCGHTHLPFSRELDGRLIVNVGSAGVPLDGDRRAAWVLLEEEPPGEAHLTFRRVDFDIARMFQLIDDHPDYPGFDTPERRAAFKKWYETGIHWRFHQPT